MWPCFDYILWATLQSILQISPHELAHPVDICLKSNVLLMLCIPHVQIISVKESEIPALENPTLLTFL